VSGATTDEPAPRPSEPEADAAAPVQDAEPAARSERRAVTWAARAVTAVVAVAALGLVYLLLTGGDADDDRSSPLLGRLVPPLAGETIDGSTFDIDDQRGRWVVVNFFASWCIPCREEHPELVAFTEGHDEAGDAVVVAVPFDNEVEDVRSFFAERGGSWPVLVTGQERAAVNFAVTGVPESYLVAPDGTVVAAFYQVTQELLDDTIAELSGAA
jgi:cytochrome c biogenesis protein CcmG/thiol:disulfide interchange protein DsbE